jgi:hypothetical protein
MRKLAFVLLLAACGGDDSASPDAPTGNHPDPMVIPGGGISGGAIDGVVNLYVIDDATRMPVSGATVRVGTIDGTTDATGLFVANGVTGKQDVVVTATGYRSVLWIGANGANMTVDLNKSNPALPQATLSGSITGFDALTVPVGHLKAAFVGYSQDDLAIDAENNLTTPNNGNQCVVTTPNTACNFQIVTRTGKVSLIAPIVDYDPHGTMTTTDDTMTLIGYAVKTGITVADGQNQSGQNLTILPSNALVTPAIDMGSPPSGLTTTLALVGIELGDGSGVFQLAMANMINQVPSLDSFTGAMYRLSAIATDAAANPQQSIVLRRHQANATLAAGTWTAPPMNASASRIQASWTPVAGATLHGVEYASGSTGVLSITSFDGASSVMIPDIITLPTGSLTVKVQALQADGLDVTDFGIDKDREKVTAIGVANVAVN